MADNPHCLMKETKRKAVFVGSFDPFTVGHANIVERALHLFDQIVIGVGVNSEKKYLFSEAERVEAIRNLYKNNPVVEVKAYHDWTANFARREGACCIVKGVRTLNDYRYERRQALFNREKSGIETVILMADQQLKDVSSTAVRKLLKQGKPTTNLLPEKQ